MTIPSGGYVLASDIGEDDGGLLCNTDRSGCCRISARGRWYHPDGREITILSRMAAGPSTSFFYRNRGTGVVRLNRQGDPPERGRFHCEIPNTNDVTVTLYVNIGECVACIIVSCHSIKFYPILVDIIPPTLPPSTITTNRSTTTHTNSVTTTTQAIDAPDTTTPPPLISISMAPVVPSGTATAGESYSLECIVTVTGSTGQPNIIWLDPMDNIITSGVMTNSSMSTLTFNPLAASHAGTYTCRAALGSAMDSASRTITVQSE